MTFITTFNCIFTEDFFTHRNFFARDFVIFPNSFSKKVFTKPNYCINLLMIVNTFREIVFLNVPIVLKYKTCCPIKKTLNNAASKKYHDTTEEVGNLKKKFSQILHVVKGILHDMYSKASVARYRMSSFKRLCHEIFDSILSGQKLYLGPL